MIAALIQGELFNDPVARASSSGNEFWTATARVPAGVDAIIVGVATFDPTAGERLMKLRKGAAFAAVGTLEQNGWIDKDGAERRGWRLSATEIMSVHQARKRRAAESDE